MRFRFWTILWAFALLICVKAIVDVFAMLQAGTAPSGEHPISNDLRQLSAALRQRATSEGDGDASDELDTLGSKQSWRVQILPYLEEKELYDRFNLDEPWNSPANSKLLGEMPSVFAYPSPDSAVSGYLRSEYHPDETTYLAITGEGTLWSSDNRLQLSDRKDHSRKTILLIHVPASGIKWTEPRDLTLEEAVELLSSTTGPGYVLYRDRLFAVERHEQAIRFVVYSSGATDVLNCGLKPEIARALCSAQGVDDATLNSRDSWLPMDRTYRQTATFIKWDRVLIAVFLFLLFIYGVYAIIWNLRQKCAFQSQTVHEDSV